jgi:sarcosine oxidase
VVGLGAMGSAAACALARRGVRTIAFERFRVGHARGSSHGPTRIFRLSYPDADYVRMAQRALGLWRDLERDAGEELLVTTGGLDAGPLAGECADSLSACGAAHEWLDPGAMAERFPGISLEGLGRALFQPDAGVCLADRTVAAQVRLAAAAGVDIREDTEVTAVRAHDDGAVVETSNGAIEADVAVVTPGAWAKHVLPDLPVRAAAQTVSYFRPVDPAATWPTFIEWEELGFGRYEVPMAGHAPGVKVAEHRPGSVVDPADGPFEPDPKAIEANARYVRERFPGLDPSPVASETCLYELTPDEHFVLDRTGPIVVGTGGSGHAFKFTPLLGEILADLAQGRAPELPVARFGAGRFR